jgi:hypothetical protein
MAPPSSSATRRAVLKALLVDGSQTAKVVVDPKGLGATPAHGFPDSVLLRYPQGIPLDLNPAWPLELDLDGERDAFKVSLSFGGVVCRCRVPWKALSVLGVGFGGVHWEHDAEPDPPGPETERRGGARRGSSGAHLRVVK